MLCWRKTPDHVWNQSSDLILQWSFQMMEVANLGSSHGHTVHSCINNFGYDYDYIVPKSSQSQAAPQPAHQPEISSAWVTERKTIENEQSQSTLGHRGWHDNASLNLAVKSIRWKAPSKTGFPFPRTPMTFLEGIFNSF